MSFIYLTIASAMALGGFALATFDPSQPGSGPSKSIKTKPKDGPAKLAYICTALLGAIAAVKLFPGQPGVAVACLGAASTGSFAGAISNHFTRKRRKRRNEGLDLAIIGLLEQVHLKLVNGNPLQTAVVSANAARNLDIVELQSMLRSGLDIEAAVAFWRAEFDTSAKQRLGDLLLAKMTAAETTSLIAGLIDQLKKEQRFQLISDIERRNQLVWLPVTIAVLIPGMIFIAIPLETTLRSLLG